MGGIIPEKSVPYRKFVVFLQITSYGKQKMFVKQENNQDSDIRHLYNEKIDVTISGISID